VGKWLAEMMIVVEMVEVKVLGGGMVKETSGFMEEADRGKTMHESVF